MRLKELFEQSQSELKNYKIAAERFVNILNKRRRFNNKLTLITMEDFDIMLTSDNIKFDDEGFLRMSDCMQFTKQLSKLTFDVNGVKQDILDYVDFMQNYMKSSSNDEDDIDNYLDKK